MNRIALLAFAALAPGCPPVPNGPPDAPNVDAGPYAPVCAHLQTLQCKEGFAPNCTSAFDKAQSSHLTDLKPACLLAAKTKAQARACGSVTCP